MGRAGSEGCGKLEKLDVVPFLERALAHPMLFRVMMSTKADQPLVRGLQARATVRASSDMRALDRRLVAAGHTAMMLPHPSAVRRTFAERLRSFDTFEPLRQLRPRHPPTPQQVWH